MIDRYILRDGQPVPEPDLEKWGRWLQTDERILRKTMIEPSLVSTVFLGLDHSFQQGPHEPILWETMVFSGPLDGEQERYSSQEEALKGHEEMCRKVHEAQQE